jgi:hypothetical protein
MSGPCVKQRVVATIVTKDGKLFVGENHCLTPQTVCPRAGMPTGVGYELCKSVCNQVGHAEVVALEAAGENARGATLILEGHTYACQSCLNAATEAGIERVVVNSIAIFEHLDEDADFPDCAYAFTVTGGPRGPDTECFPYSDSSERRDQLQNARDSAAQRVNGTNLAITESLMF